MGDKVALQQSSSKGTPCECEECEEPSNNRASAEKFAEIAHKEATEGASVDSYRAETWKVANETSREPGEDFPESFSGTTMAATNGGQTWGGGCSAFVYWCALQMGLEPGEHLPIGAELVTWAAEDAVI